MTGRVSLRSDPVRPTCVAVGSALTSDVQAPDSVAATQAIHVGRQALYDRAGDVVGYELLFRGGSDAVSATRRNAYATSQVIVSAFTEFGLEQLVGDRPCFINLTREFLVGDLPVPFDYTQTVLEILPSVVVDDEVIAGVQKLADGGYTIALDDFNLGDGRERLLPLAAYVKLDMLRNTPEELATMVRRVREYPEIALVAMRMESEADLGRAFALGFDLFQGHALGHPHVVSSRRLSPSRLRRLELLAALAGDDVDLDRVVSTVTGDPALSFHLLRATNSAALGLNRTISSVREAVVVLGLSRVREWVVLMLITDVAEVNEDQLAGTMIRARLCQYVAERTGLAGDAGFTVGLLSGVAELINEPVRDLVERMPLTEDIITALTGSVGPLAAVLSTVLSYEVSDLAALDGGPVDSVDLVRAYLAALGWSNNAISSALSGGA